MNYLELEDVVFSGVANASLGTVLLCSLDKTEIEAAAKGFFEELLVLLRKTQLGPQLEAPDGITLESVNDFLRESANSGNGLDPANRARRVLVILAHLIIAGRLFPERPSDLELLGDSVKSLPHIPAIPQAAECLLNAAYRCEDPEVRVAAGRYYLEILDAEFGTALGFFGKATETDSSYSRVVSCDRLVRQFKKTRAVVYPFGGLKPYLEAWEEHKRDLSMPKANPSADPENAAR